VVRRALLALVTGSLMLPTGAIPAAPPPETFPRTASAGHGVKPFSTFYTLRHVRRLSGRIGVRVRGTKAEKNAARYFRRRLQDKGYVTNVQRFKVNGGSSRNVVAWWPGARRYPFVIGAHIDTVSGSPGANDNASGVAILIDLARALAGRRHVRNVRLVAFGSEEYGSNGIHHVGSHVFVNRLGTKGRRRLAGMLSVDMVADGRPLIIGTAGIGPTVVARTLHRRLKRAGFNVVYRTTCDCSDNGPFELAGIPGSFMWTGTEPNYHDPSDTVANLSRRDLRRSGRAVRRFVTTLDLKTVRQFRAKG
jgi:aminopeptidase YwaD